jgi:hypothetical protein
MNFENKKSADETQEELNRKQVDAMFDEGGNDPVAKEGPVSEKTQEEKNREQIDAMFDEGRVNPSEEKNTKGADEAQGEAMESWIKRNSADTPKAETATETKTAENPEKGKSLREIGHEKIVNMTESGKKIWRNILEGAKNILGKGKARWESIKKGISDSRKWLEDQTENMGTSAPGFDAGSMETGVQKNGESGKGIYEKGKQIGASGIEGIRSAAEFTVGAVYEGGRLAKKGAEFVINKAAEKIKLLEERGSQAFENLSARTRSAINKFRDYRNQKRLEKVDQKYWKKIGGLNTKISELEILRKNLKEGDIKNLGRLSTKIAELQIKKEGMERKNNEESAEEKMADVINLDEFRTKKQKPEAQEPGSMREAV